MSREGTILVLGAYGLVGRELIGMLVDKTGATVIASGRKADRLAAVTKGLDEGRVVRRVLDASDAPALAAACAGASLVINCIGPYIESGAAVARAAIESGASYVDFASEQVHYERLQGLDAAARDKGLFLLTGAGSVPGLSAVLVLVAESRIGAIESIEILYAQRGMPSADGGLGSLMTGVLEAGFTPVALRDGQRVPVRLGENRKRFTLPSPIGEAELIGFPSLETLTLSERLPVRSIASYWFFGEIPPILFTLIRALKPHRRPWAYRLLRRLAEWAMRREYERGVAKGVEIDALLRVSARREGKGWQATLRFPEGGGVPTAYLPAITAKRFLESRFHHVGLVTPVDVFTPDELFAEMRELGWTLDLEEHTVG